MSYSVAVLHRSMPSPGEHPIAGSARFKTTRWSLVIAAADRSTPESGEALARLCETYWLPVYAFVRRRGYQVEDASDLTQEFFARMLDRGDFTRARPDRGRFRTFMLAAVTYFLANETDRRRAIKRGGRVQVLPFEITSVEERLSLEPRDEMTPDRVFERHWALSVLEAALARLRAECVAAGRGRQFELLQPYLTGDGPSVPYAEVARALGLSEGAVKIKVHRLRRRFGAMLRDEVAQTVLQPDEIDAELRHLIKVASE